MSRRRKHQSIGYFILVSTTLTAWCLVFVISLLDTRHLFPPITLKEITSHSASPSAEKKPETKNETTTPTSPNQSTESVTPEIPSEEEPDSNQNNNLPEITPTPIEITKGNTTKKQIILTFDAGSGNQSVEKILSTLSEEHLTATFFITGSFANQYPTDVKKISNAGHEIFNHTYNHPHLTQLTATQIESQFQQTEDIILNLTGKTTKPFFRPPYGERNQAVLDTAWQQGYQSIYWTVDALDWKESEGVTADQVKQRIYANLQPGTIYLMHLGDNITGNILEEVITYIYNQGYTVVPLSEGIK